MVRCAQPDPHLPKYTQFRSVDWILWFLTGICGLWRYVKRCHNNSAEYFTQLWCPTDHRAGLLAHSLAMPLLERPYTSHLDSSVSPVWPFSSSPVPPCPLHPKCSRWLALGDGQHVFQNLLVRPNFILHTKHIYTGAASSSYSWPLHYTTWNHPFI